MKRTGELGSVHYDERLICDLWEELMEFADSTTSKFTVDYDSTTTEFETPNELQNATQIPDRITEFELSIRASDGYLRLSAGPQGHQYTIRGEENWVRRMSDYLREFSSKQENELRTTLSNRRLRLLQISLISGLIGAFWNKITALVLPFYFVNLTEPQWYIFVGIVSSIILIQIGKHVYPTVEFRRRGAQPRFRQAIFILTLIGSIFSILQGAYRYL